MTSALLIIDVQHALCCGEEAAFDIDAVIARINALSSRARAAGMPVILVQHEEDDGPLRFGSAGWALAQRLLSTPEDLRIRKKTPNSFHQTGLRELLQERGVSRLVICGLQTEFCVDTTVRQALPLGFGVALASDAHSTTDGVLRAEQVIAHHNRTLRGMTSYGPRVDVKPAAELRLED
ncbi:MAG TPA: cysteine hydrolase family protein [Albitalea sp.]